MRKWIKNKKNRFAIALIGAQVILLMYFIVPVRDKIAYYQDKTRSSLLESDRMKKHSFYLELRREKLAAIGTKLDALRERTGNIDAGDFQILLGKLQREQNLTMISQKIENRESRNLYDKIVVRQSLEGKYEDHVKYLRSLSSLNRPIILSECGYESADSESEDSLQADLDLSAKLEFIYFIPNAGTD